MRLSGETTQAPLHESDAEAGVPSPRKPGRTEMRDLEPTGSWGLVRFGQYTRSHAVMRFIASEEVEKESQRCS